MAVYVPVFNLGFRKPPAGALFGEPKPDNNFMAELSMSHPKLELAQAESGTIFVKTKDNSPIKDIMKLLGHKPKFD